MKRRDTPMTTETKREEGARRTWTNHGNALGVIVAGEFQCMYHDPAPIMDCRSLAPALITTS